AGPWQLPASIGDETSVVFGGVFSMLDRVVETVSEHLASRFAGESVRHIEALIEQLTAQVSDTGFANKVRAAAQPQLEALREQEALFQFNRKFIFRVIGMAHAQLAQLIGARGPAISVNAA